MTTPVVTTKLTATKAIVAAMGTISVAATTTLAVIATAIGDDAIDVTEVGAIAAALSAFAVTVWGVWKAPNTEVPVNPPVRASAQTSRTAYNSQS